MNEFVQLKSKSKLIIINPKQHFDDKRRAVSHPGISWNLTWPIEDPSRVAYTIARDIP